MNCLRYAQAAWKELTKKDLLPDGLSLHGLMEPSVSYMKQILLQFIYLFLEDRNLLDLFKKIPGEWLMPSDRPKADWEFDTSSPFGDEYQLGSGSVCLNISLKGRSNSE